MNEILLELMTLFEIGVTWKWQHLSEGESFSDFSFFSSFTRNAWEIANRISANPIFYQ